MSTKIKCPNCSGGFTPTLEAFALGKAQCPGCLVDIPIAGAQASEVLALANLARGRFATGAPVLLDAPTGDDFDIQWMPPGRQEPTVYVADDPRQLKFTVKPQHATAFDAMLQRLIALAKDGKGDLPFIDFDHADGAASGRPTQFYWGGDDAKKGGIRLKGKWTASGKAAVTGEAPEFTRFSPEWYFDDHDEPLAIGVNLGGLVNRAAFKTIASVKAGAATKQPETKMTKEEMQSLLTEALKPLNNEIAALKAQAKGTDTGTALTVETLTQAVAKAVDPINAKITSIETARLEERKAQAKAAVQVHVKRGAIKPAEKLPSGKLVVEHYEEMHLANAADAEAALAMLPGTKPGLIIHRAGDGGTATSTQAEFTEPENRALAGAKKFREANKAIASDAEALEAYLRTSEGQQVYRDILAARSNERRDLAGK